jgi:hypothetical protein
MPLQKRVSGEKSRGYFRSEFEDAFRRYVPESGTNGTSVTEEPDPPTPFEEVMRTRRELPEWGALR